jgi:hypothetical protein
VSVPISAVVSSSQQMQSLTATIGNVSTPLLFDASIGRWTGTLSLDSLTSPGVRQLVVAATSVSAEHASANLFLRFDQPPRITVTSPADSAVAAPTVHLAASCTDDGAAGCVSFRAFVPGSENDPLATGTTAIDAVVSLAVYTGDVAIAFEAVDAAGQISRVVRTVRVQH